MKSPAPAGPGKAPESPAGDESTGVPMFRTWRGVYGFVLVCFVIYVCALMALSRIFS
jgi:hypothetical protein